MKKFFLLILFLPSILFAAFEVQYPPIPGYSPRMTHPVEAETVALYIKYIFDTAVKVIGVIAFFGLVLGGIKYLSSRGDPTRLKEAKDQISACFFGMLILLSSYLLLRQIKTEFVQIAPQPLEMQEKIPAESLPPPEETTLTTYLQLPIESALKLDLFKKERMEEISTTSREILEIVSTPQNPETLLDLNQELKDLTHSCRCSNTKCSGCKKCTCDPCRPVRGRMDEIISKSSEKIKEMQEKAKKLDKEKRQFDDLIKKLKETLRIMRDVCPMSVVLSRDNFISIKQYYKEHGWEAKETKLWEDLPNLLLNSFADFYCPVSGTRKGEIPLTNEEAEIIQRGLPSAPEIGGATSVEYEFEGHQYKYEEVAGHELEILKKMQQKYKTPEQFETTFTCPNSIPFGEIMDKILKFSQLYENKIGGTTTDPIEKGLVLLVDEFIDKVNRFHEAVSTCSSVRCHCPCEPSCDCSCEGTPCDYRKINETFDELEKTAKKIEDRTAQIVGFSQVFKDFSYDSEYIKKKLEKLTREGVSGAKAEVIIFVDIGEGVIDQKTNREVIKGVVEAIEKLNLRFPETVEWVNRLKAKIEELKKLENKKNLTDEELRKELSKFVDSLENEPYQVREISQLILLLIEFEKMAARIHFCIAATQELEMGWLDLNCEKCACGEECVGSPVIDPDGQKMRKKDVDCLCEKTKECREYFPLIKEYECTQITCDNLNLKCDETNISGRDRCYDYNFFCCHVKH